MEEFSCLELNCVSLDNSCTELLIPRISDEIFKEVINSVTNWIGHLEEHENNKQTNKQVHYSKLESNTTSL